MLGASQSQISPSRRELLLGAFCAVLGNTFHRANPAKAASECFEGATVGEYLRTFSPQAYGELSSKMRDLLDSSPMYSEAPLPRTSLVQDVSISAWKSGVASIGYSFRFSCSHPCPSLYALVTVTNLSTGVSQSKEFYGSGSQLSGSGTASDLPSGSYRAVVTAYPPVPPAGMEGYYSQDWANVSL